MFEKRTRILKAVLLIALISGACVLAGALASGCGTTSAGTPSQIVTKAIDAQGKLNSVQVNVQSDIELDVPGGNRSSSLSYKGSFEKPDHWNLTIRSSGGKSQVIISGQRTWVKLQGADVWTEKQNSSPLTGSNPDDVVASKYLKSAKNVKLVDQKDGLYHLNFDLDILSFARAFQTSGIDPALLKGKVAHVDIWVRQKGFFLEKATMDFASRLTEPVVGTLKMTTEVDFSAFNEPVSIEPPI